MARFTNIGLPRKTFVSSSAEERQGQQERQRDGGDDQQGGKRKGGWGRDPSIAKRAKLAADRSEERRQKRVDARQFAKTCFACRGVGHSARDCPNILLAASGASGSAALLEADQMAARRDKAVTAEDTADGQGQGQGEGEEGKEETLAEKRRKGKKSAKTGSQLTSGRCYRCNSEKHSLGHCPKPLNPADPTPFATCFVCLQSGHLASKCPQNPKGVYVKGGSCKLCGSVRHLIKDCPENKNQGRDGEGEGQDQDTYKGRGKRRDEIVLGTGTGAGADEDDFMTTHRAHTRNFEQAPRGNKAKHEPAKNGSRGLAKKTGDDGAYVPPPPVVQASGPAPGVPGAMPGSAPAPAAVVRAAAAKPKAKSKVVSF